MITYNIPPSALASHPASRLVVRSHSASLIVRSLAESDLQRLDYVQLLTPEADVEPLAAWGDGIPVDVVLASPALQYTELYRLATLRERHPVRVTIRVVPGFSKAVRLAAALQFAVKLDVRQPGPDVVDELLEVLDLYLHWSTVSQPIEFFHSILLSMLYDSGESLWAIQEEDPAGHRYVTDDRAEAVSGRRPDEPVPADPAGFVDDLERQLRSESAECIGCEAFAVCRGYFKWPERDYDCAGVRRIFGELRAAAENLKLDLEPSVET